MVFVKDVMVVVVVMVVTAMLVTSINSVSVVVAVLWRVAFVVVSLIVNKFDRYLCQFKNV